MADRHGYSLVSLLVGLGIALSGTALAVRCLIITGRSVVASHRGSASLLERYRAGEFLASILSWSGCGDPGGSAPIESNAREIRLHTRPEIDGRQEAVSVALSGDNLTVQRTGGRRWTIVGGCLPSDLFLVGNGVVGIPLGEGLDLLIPVTPTIDHPLEWGGE